MCVVSANPKAYNAALNAARSVARWAAMNYPACVLWDEEELRQEARYQYTRAVAQWDGRGELAGWVGYFVRKKLISHVRKELGRHLANPPKLWPFRNDALDGGKFCRRAKPNLTARVAELSDSARTVAELVFAHVSHDMSSKARNKGQRVRRSVTRRLRFQGWSAARVDRAFQELSEVV
jgi:DNA-directed RNA polymerase specialized sigma24 family protein